MSTTPEISLLIPAKNSGHALETTVREAIRHFSIRWPGRFEIILIPNPAPGDRADRSLEISEKIARESARETESVRVTPHCDAPGKGAALKTGVSQSRGKWVCFTDADLPYSLDFFDRAIPELESGAALVTGNRRLATSEFDIPVGLLPVAYGRHRLGLLFNRAVRLFLPIPTTDTQAGIKAMSRELADLAFTRMECPGFFFDLEIFLTARARGMKHAELPVTLFLNTEKSTVHLIRDAFQALRWLARIHAKNKRGDYA